MCRSAVSVLCSPRLAVWHFLASFPFGRLTARTSWRLLWLFHTSGRQQETAEMPAVPHDQDDGGSGRGGGGGGAVGLGLFDSTMSHLSEFSGPESESYV